MGTAEPQRQAQRIGRATLRSLQVLPWMLACLLITDFSHVIFFSQIPLSMNVSTFLAYDQPTISYCGVHHELLSHKSFETNAQEDTLESHLETELDLSTITSAGRISDHKPQLT